MADQRWFNTNYGCPLCSRLHAIRQCSRFAVMPVEKKLRVVADHALCTNCLAQSHLFRECRSLDRCKRCAQRHNTLLHPVEEGHVWFPMTAMVKLFPHQMSPRHAVIRVLLDPNAARSSITSKTAEKAGCLVSFNRTMVTLGHRRFDHKRLSVICVVEDSVPRYTPPCEIDNTLVRLRGRHVVNADALWYSRDEIDMVLGADVIPKVLEGPAEGKHGQIKMQRTFFGDAYFGEGKEETNPDYLEYE